MKRAAKVDLTTPLARPRPFFLARPFARPRPFVLARPFAVARSLVIALSLRLTRSLAFGVLCALGALCLLAPTPAHAQEVETTPAVEDPFLWLENIEGDRSMEWVEAHNQATLAALSEQPTFEPIYERVLQILDSDDRIAYPNIMGDWLYNFWQDDEHERGIWRRTTWDAYLSGNPQWETVLDIDALAEAEDVSWAYAGSTCLPPEYRLCLVRLSRGGADAVEIREFDTQTKRFVEGGFFLPEAKQSVAWKGPDTLLVATDFGPGSLTESGYARIAKVWPRGTSLDQARTLFEGETSDVSVNVGSFRTVERDFHVVYHRPSFFRGTMYLLEGGELQQVELPLDADPGMFGEQIVVYLRSPWDVGGASYEPGTLIAMDYARFLAGERDFDVVVDPGERATVEGWRTTRDYLLVSMLNNVRGEVRRYTLEGGEWSYEVVPAPEFSTINIGATSPLHNRYFFTSSGFTQPTTLYYVGEDGEPREVRSMPQMFEAEGLVVEQHEATSKDGTRIPYFLVHAEGMALDGRNPTLLYGYGGFEISMTPGYSATTGAAWLERGGTYALANIRGGGEFGPDWHRAALKENRQRAYDDFIAVAEDLIETGVTSPEHLGIRGGSNGGLLMGVMLTQRPELFDAIVIQVPLFDMRRYDELLAGASWIAEYGDPDNPEAWAYISQYSPYQNLRADQPYPRVLITTTTRDDRVHPGHARKAAAKLESLGYPVYYYENTEGGHGSGVTSEQRARMQALVYTYLWQRLEQAETASGEAAAR